MKIPFYSKFLIIACISCLPAVTFAQSPQATTDLIAQMQKLLDQYSARITNLEAENLLLRTTMAKYDIQIPLEEYNRAMTGSGSAISKAVANSVIASNVAPNLVQPSTSVLSQNALEQGFIDQIRLDWIAIRGAYEMPADARLGAYEFVVGYDNIAFADIIYGNGTSDGAYNAKLLYEFNKQTFKRKLIGFFEYKPENKGYITRRGTNPYAQTERRIIRESIAPVISNVVTTQSSQIAPQPSTQNSQVSNNSTPAAIAPTEVEAKLQEAYNKKDWASLVRISDDYLRKNPPTYRVILYRYRMLFLQREFNKALAEIKKLEDVKLATGLVYCDAYAIAQYAGNQKLAKQYQKLAGAGCNLK